MRAVVALALMPGLTGCAILAGNPYADLGADQDRVNRRVNAQYPASLPERLPTDYEARGRALDNGAAAAEWKEIFDLFRGRPAKLPFRDEPARCSEPGQIYSSSVTLGCECRTQAHPAVGESSSR